ncbi:glycoside hydrolase family 97 protein [Pinibacter aurantiacus]|uniref:Glycoside hydrolase family 97 protein n=1 Tax=Pinibacter aurantiacus TaxID=2851599 RepID=A0A9E2W5J8_9BACT|nr:glycoside hydrolase family 97 protein [Pinibacter aurantiacus]MBV4358728.1 glycoside hydrolase family 97 protein [Pinibacter aurantiacus]
MRIKPLLLCVIIFCITIDLHAQEIFSPNGKIKVVVSLPNKTANEIYFTTFYKVNNGFIEAMPASPLGINRADEQFVNNLQLTKESKSISIHDRYQIVCGKRLLCENFGTEKTFSFQNSNHQPINIVFRVYNDGVAFRYEFPDRSFTAKNILDEATTYNFPDNTNRWMQPFEAAYENFYPLNKTGIGEGKSRQEWGFPALYQVNDQPVYVLISEANISENNCAAKLSNLQNKNQYKVVYPEQRKEFPHTGVVTTLPWSSQWHTLIIGKLSDIVESTLITDVSKSNQLKETNWIKPGAVSWIYWANNNGSKDYKKVVEYVDGAAAMRWPYVLIDWQWDIMSNGGNIIDAVNYAKSKNIKPLVWYNSSTNAIDTSNNSNDWFKYATPLFRLNTPEKRAQEFSWLRKIGVYGIKVDFFAGDQQDMMKYYIDILKDAAKYQLMVNFHGATVPRGWQRTYPNLMTTEAVYGAEWYNNGPTLTNKAAAHNTTLPFTRNVVGAMDYTPVTFSNSQFPHITSYAHELALAVVFESGWQHFADKPDAYHSLPEDEKNFLQNFPTAWEDTKLIDGYPAEKVIMARKKNGIWYVGGLNGKDERQTLVLNVNFLKDGNYELQLIKDGHDDKSFLSEKIKVKKGDTIKVECLARGGFAGVIKKMKE